MNITKTNETNATAQFLATFLFRLVHPPWNVDYFFSLVVVIYCAYSLSLSVSSLYVFHIMSFLSLRECIQKQNKNQPESCAGIVHQLLTLKS